MASLPLGAIGLRTLTDGILAASMADALNGAALIVALTGVNRLMFWISMTVRMRMRENTEVYVDAPDGSHRGSSRSGASRAPGLPGPSRTDPRRPVGPGQSVQPPVVDDRLGGPARQCDGALRNRPSGVAAAAAGWCAERRRDHARAAPVAPTARITSGIEPRPAPSTGLDHAVVGGQRDPHFRLDRRAAAPPSRAVLRPRARASAPVDPRHITDHAGLAVLLSVFRGHAGVHRRPGPARRGDRWLGCAGSRTGRLDQSAVVHSGVECRLADSDAWLRG